MNQSPPRLVSMILRQSRSNRTRPNRGFALVITMSLMVLLMILAVGLLGLSSIELRSSGATSAAMQARANARLALQIAIGELQLQAGPDQRITASGGQKVKEGKSGRKNWVGVYNSWSDKEVSRPEPSFRRWLISGNEQLTASEAAAQDENPLATSTVALASATDESDAVDAGLVDVKDGAYAWWISDNNMKAKIGNTVAAPKDYKETMAQMQAAPWASLEPFFDGPIAKTDTRLNSLFTVGTANLVGKPTVPIFHDATTIAEGLVTNVRSGGFRKDLSLYLEKPYDIAMWSQPLYSVGSGTKTPGINFGELWAAQNIWGEVLTSGAPSHPDGGTMGGPYLRAPSDLKEAIEDPFRTFHQLTRVQHSIIYSLIARAKAGSATGEHEIYLVADPVMTIWNPFNIAVTVPVGKAWTSFQNWGAPYDLELKIKSGLTTRTFSKNIPTITGGGNFNMARVGKDAAVVLRPGEVLVYSQSYNAKLTSAVIEAKLGWGFGAGYEFNMSTPKDVNDTRPMGPVKAIDSISFKLTPTSASVSNGLGLVFARQFLNDEDGNGYGDDLTGIGNMSIDFTTMNVSAGTRDGDKLKASGAPGFFKTIDDPSYTKTVANMVVPANTNGASRKWPLFMFNLSFRTESDEYGGYMSGLLPANPAPRRYTSRALMGLNPKILTYDLLDLSPQATNETPLQIGVRSLQSSSGMVPMVGAGQGYFGASFTQGTSYVVTHAVPRQPIYSLGALQHSLGNGLLDYKTVGANTYQRVQYLRPSISHAIGNSFAPSIMSPGQTETVSGSTKYTHALADHSYLANRALWDDYFYSSASPHSTTAQKNSSTAYSEQKQSLTNFFVGANQKFVPLPNSRFRPWGADSEGIVDQLFPSGKPAAQAYERIGSHMLVDGAFNVNSTSEKAWESMLLALKGTSVPVAMAMASSKEPDLISSSKTPSAGLLIASGGEISESQMGNANSPDQWVGFRTMTDAQITELSKAIVKQVKLRGPFTSLSDFVNRRPGTNKDLALSGALQSALDDSSVTINKEYRSGSRAGNLADANAKGFAFPEAEAIAKSAGAPGYVKQGDLLTTLGPLISVRGDTFTIRTCGEARDSQGKVLARAYCEAVVQRVPDYVDGTDANYVVEPNSSANKQFGRKFQLISFRNLSPDEI